MSRDFIMQVICLLHVASCGVLAASYLWFEAPPVSLILVVLFAMEAADASKEVLS